VIQRYVLNIEHALTMNNYFFTWLVNRDIKLEYTELKLKQKEYTKYEADIFRTMVSKMN
jgi:hypothetical protein